MEAQTHEEILSAMKKASVDSRGSILEAVSQLEWMIDCYIAGFFTGKDDVKFQEFISFIFTPYITFRNKIEIFRAIADKNNPDFLKKYPGYFNDFLKIVDDRNVFAHYPLHTLWNGVEKFVNDNRIEYIKFKHRKEQGAIELIQMKGFTDNDVNKLLTDILNYTDEIMTLIESA